MKTRIHFKDNYHLDFDLYDGSLASRWAEEINKVNDMGIVIDEPERFYNMPNTEYDHYNGMNNIIATIKAEAPEIISFVDTVTEENCNQDMLNQLHHVFEVHHGLYDTQDTNPLFQRVSLQCRKALNELNLMVHRIESIGTLPRFVSTWYDKPPRQALHEEDYGLFTLEQKWGEMYINYVEVGKSLQDLTYDDDDYIDVEAAFKPLQHYSCDVTVRFNDSTPRGVSRMKYKINQYRSQHEEFFAKYDNLSIGRLPIGMIDMEDNTRKEILNELSQHAFIERYEIIK